MSRSVAPGPAVAISAAALGANVADQVMLATIPLLLAAQGAPAGAIAAAVAAQATAWLLVSLPMGVAADRANRRTLMAAAAALIGLAAVGAALGVTAGAAGPSFLGGAGFALSAGVVTIVLCCFALLPRHVAANRLPVVNARIELGRAVMMVAAPLAAGELIARGRAEWIFVAVALIAALILAATLRLPREAPSPAPRLPLGRAIAEGCRFVAREPILRAIALCAVFWNAAFFALLASFTPHAMAALGADAAGAGRALAANGAGLLAGAIVAPALIARAPTGPLFVFGPAASLAGVVLVATAASADALGAAGAGFFLIGFGPMIWLVLQTTVRQLLTPPTHLARVSATLTTAIYGVRPLGALAAAGAAALAGPSAGLWLAAALFALSLGAILVSPAPALSGLPQATAPAQ